MSTCNILFGIGLSAKNRPASYIRWTPNGDQDRIQAYPSGRKASAFQAEDVRLCKTCLPLF
jgi:hypothetical protein